MKPYEHAEASAKVFGGKFEDYINIHRWFDQFRFAIKDPNHRLFLHHTAGVLICEQVHGDFIVNSDGKHIAVRDIAEHHITTDLGEMRTPQEWLENIGIKEWVKPVKSKIEKLVNKAEHKIKDEVESIDIDQEINNISDTVEQDSIPDLMDELDDLISDDEVNEQEPSIIEEIDEIDLSDLDNNIAKDDIVCKGSIALGTGCDNCKRCKEELETIKKTGELDALKETVKRLEQDNENRYDPFETYD